MHGGGFAAGSGNEILAYDGENMSRRGDVVVVTHNHRLNAFGYLNLAELGGEKYASSGNVGMLDQVAVLEWVRDNISNFGGDPGNVMIFGQSGGGGKVNAMMAMPAAMGLFHRAVVQSGSMLRMGEPEDSTKLAAAVLAQLNLSKSQIDQLQTIPAGSSHGRCPRGRKRSGDSSHATPACVDFAPRDGLGTVRRWQGFSQSSLRSYGTRDICPCPPAGRYRSE